MRTLRTMLGMLYNLGREIEREGPGGPTRRLVGHQRRTKPVRNRAWRLANKRAQPLDNRICRRVESLLVRDDSAYAAKVISQPTQRMRTAKPLNRAEWRFLVRVSSSVVPDTALPRQVNAHLNASLMLDWSGR